MSTHSRTCNNTNDVWHVYNFGCVFFFWGSSSSPWEQYSHRYIAVMCDVRTPNMLFFRANVDSHTHIVAHLCLLPSSLFDAFVIGCVEIKNYSLAADTNTWRQSRLGV